MQADKIAWLGRIVDWLGSRGIELAYQARHLNQLADAIAKRIESLAQQSRKTAFQQALFGTGTEKASIAAHLGFRFDPKSYPARWFFNGRFVFQRHYYPRPGELDDDLAAEETACAIELDSMPEVRHWVRNLSQQPLSSFWLPTSTDRFYPDFVAELTDGRLFVVEYKGAIYFDTEDSREKRDIGSVWQSASEGRCVFAMPTSAAKAGKPVSVQLREALSGGH